jgi:hypothetical protein
MQFAEELVQNGVPENYAKAITKVFNQSPARIKRGCG